MKRKFLIGISLLLIISFLGACQEKESSNPGKLQVAVSIVPQETFVKAVAGESVDIVTLIPPGSSPENYQPSPQQMTELSKSRIYFSIGVQTEAANIMPTIKDISKDIKVVELAPMVDKVYPARYFEDENENNHEHEGRDPHIWLSPRRVMVMIETIRDELSNIDPQNKEVYEQNASDYIKKLEDLDKTIQVTMNKLENKTFIIMHPSMGYFADDYGLEMIPLEEEGKEKTASRLQDVIDYAIKKNIKVVFYQAEFDNQQAKTLASEIGGEAMELEPLSPNYTDNLIKINDIFRSVLK